MSAPQSNGIALVQRLCDELTRLPRSPDDVARGLGTITDRQPSAVYVAPRDPQLTQVVLSLEPDGTVGYVDLRWRTPQSSLDELQALYGTPRLPPVLHPGPRKRVFILDNSARPLTCHIVATPTAIGARSVARVGIMPQPRLK